jgi:hypothetical protein
MCYANASISTRVHKGTGLQSTCSEIDREKFTPIILAG